MGINVLHHVTVKTDDLAATRDFYRDLLGARVRLREKSFGIAAQMMLSSRSGRPWTIRS
jgi:catechol 2,3-dioxygenase-like lactoylglutathione lyase family enzyme